MQQNANPGDFFLNKFFFKNYFLKTVDKKIENSSGLLFRNHKHIFTHTNILNKFDKIIGIIPNGSHNPSN